MQLYTAASNTEGTDYGSFSSDVGLVTQSTLGRHLHPKAEDPYCKTSNVTVLVTPQWVHVAKNISPDLTLLAAAELLCRGELPYALLVH